MTKMETVQMLALMRTAWPRFYANQTESELDAAVLLWHGELADEDPQVVIAALKDCIRTSQFPPVVADIFKRISAIKHAETPGASEAFALLKKAVQRGIYNSHEEYERLPDACKSFVGGPSGLKDMAMMDEETLDTVTRGQFLRQYDVIVEKERIRASIPAAVRDLIDGGVKALEGGTF